MFSKQGMHKVCFCKRLVPDSITEGVFAIVLVNKIAFTQGAAGEKLDGIHPALFGFNNGHEFFIEGSGAQLGQISFRRMNAACQSRTPVSVK